MRAIHAMRFLAGLALAAAGCVFSPGLESGGECDKDDDCKARGECVCLEGRCVPAEPGGSCALPDDCGLGETNCDGDCVDLDTDPEHCGACYTECDPGEDCAGGDCRCGSEPACAAGWACCAEACVDTDTDPAHCGGCTMACEPGEVCIGGDCRCGSEPACAAGLNCCDGACVDLGTDPGHCGGCGTVCDDPPADDCEGDTRVQYPVRGECIDGECDYPPSYEDCPGGCAGGVCEGDPCGGRCEADEECVDGRCLCGGEECTGDATCEAGRCLCGQQTCEPDETCDAGDCYCGNTICQNDTTCAGDRCICAGWDEPCPDGLICCAGACVDAARSPAHCGQCGRDCYSLLGHAKDISCDGGVCYHGSCIADWTSCNAATAEDGCESHPWIDPDHCGDCATICAAGRICARGDCVALDADNQRSVGCGPQGQTCSGLEQCCRSIDEARCVGRDDASGCPHGVLLDCDDDTDCPEDHACCLSHLQLVATCTSGGCPGGDVRLCRTDEDCPDGQSCHTSAVDIGSVSLNLGHCQYVH